MTSTTTKATTIPTFNETPIFLGCDTGRLIYLCKDGLYALTVDRVGLLYDALAEEASVGPHPFCGRVQVIRVNGIHADRLVAVDQLPALTRPESDQRANLTADTVINEWADWCEEVVDLADDDDGAPDFLAALTQATRVARAIVDAAELAKVQRRSAAEELDAALEECDASLTRADLIRIRSMVMSLANKGRVLTAA